MEPVYFPFTHVSPSTFDLLGVCFRRTIVYQPVAETIASHLKARADTGGIDIRVPVNDDAGRLIGLLEEYRQWAGLHAGRNMRFFKTQSDRVPFFDDTSPHRLSAELKKRTAETPAIEASVPEPLFDARVFLAVAQDFDGRQDELENGLSAYRAMERKFLNDLTCAPELPDIGLGGGPALHAPDPGGHMTAERLRAFARLAREDKTEERLFITTSPAVIDALTDMIEPAREVLRLTDMPFPDHDVNKAFQDALAAHILQLLEHGPGMPETAAFQEFKSDGQTKLSLVLYHIPMTREAFLDACIRQTPVAAVKAFETPPGQGLLIGMIGHGS